MRILVLSPDPLPLPGMPVRPLGLRAWSLAFGLRSARMADVHIACPARDGVELPPIPDLHTFQSGGEAALIDSIKPDVLLTVSPSGLLALPDVQCPTILDVSRLQATAKGVATIRKALARADLVTCATPTAAHFLTPLMIESGFEQRKPTIIALCLAPDQPPIASRKGNPAVLALRLDSDYTAEEVESLRAVVEGKSGATLEVIARSDEVTFDNLLMRLTKADLAITMRPDGELRAINPCDATLLAMWAGVPVIHDADDPLTNAIAADRAGWCAEDDLPRVIGRLLAKPDDVRRRAPRAAELVRNSYTWNNAVAPLVEWLNAGPKRRDKGATTELQSALPAARKTRLRAGEVSAAVSPLGRISYAPPPAAPEKATTVSMGVTILAMALLLPIGVMLLLLFGIAELLRPFLAVGSKKRLPRR
jgi:hypothetical protein